MLLMTSALSAFLPWQSDYARTFPSGCALSVGATSYELTHHKGIRSSVHMTLLLLRQVEGVPTSTFYSVQWHYLEG